MAVVLSGASMNCNDGITPPTKTLVVSRNFGIPWPGLGDLFVVCAYSKESVPFIDGSPGAWALGWSQDSAPEDIGGEGHIRVWWMINSHPAPTTVLFGVSLDPPGYGSLTLYDVPEPVLDGSGSTVDPWLLLVQ